MHKQDSHMGPSNVFSIFTMNGKRIPATVRGQIIEAAAWQSVRAVASRFGCSSSTVSRLVRLKEAGKAEPPLKHAGGRPRRISEQARACIRQTLLAKRWYTTQEIVITLHDQGILVSTVTVRRIMKQIGLRRCVALRKPFLSDAATATRLAYAREHVNDDLDLWRRTLCCDEAAIRLNLARRPYVTRYPGEELLVEYLAPKLLSSRESIMLWGAVWHGGRSELVLFDTSQSSGKRGGVTAAIYRDQITRGALRQANLQVTNVWRGYGRPRLLEDNAPIHTSQTNRAQGHSFNFSYLNHPPSSPDLNPIENMWSRLKRDLGKLPRRPNSLNELFIAATACWHNIPQEFIDNCIDSMRRRLEAVLEAEGGHTKY